MRPDSRAVPFEPESDGPSHLAEPRWAAVVEWSLIALGVIALAVLLPRGIFGDGAYRYRALVKLLEVGQLQTGVRQEGQFSLLMPLASAPLYLVGRALRDPEGWTACFNAAL